MAQESLTYDEWVRRAASEEVPPPADGVLHFGERAALVEQLSYLKRRNAKLSRQQRAVAAAAPATTRDEAPIVIPIPADFAAEVEAEITEQNYRAALDALEKERAE